MRWGPFALLLVCACSRVRAPVSSVSAPPLAPVEPTRGLMDAAVDIIGGNVGALVHMSRLSNEPTTWSVSRVGGFGRFLDDAELDASTDVERVFVTATNVVSCRPVIVVQHRLTTTEAVFERLLAKSKPPGKRVVGLGVPAVYVKTRRTRQLVFAPRPNALVTMPRDLAPWAGHFIGSKPLPAPVSDELWFGWSNEFGWPPFPSALAGFSLTSGTLTTYATEKKHVIKLRGHAYSQTSARENRDILQRAADRVLKMPVIGAMLIDPIEFRVDGDEVATDVMLNPPEHQWILAHMTDGCW